MKKLLPYLVVIGISLLCPLILFGGYYLTIKEYRTSVNNLQKSVAKDTVNYISHSNRVVYSDYEIMP